jgi:CRP-like cAMP-binding protein
MMLLLDGALKLSHHVPGNGDVPLGTLTSGLLGEAVFVGDKKRNATVTAVTDGSVFELGPQAIEFLQARGVGAQLVRLRELRTITADGDRVPVLRELEPSTRDAILLHAETLAFQHGEAIVREGEASEGVYVVLAGEVEVSAKAGPLAETPIRRGRGSVIGEGTLMGAARRNATVTAVGEVQLLSVAGEQMRALLTSHPDLHYYFLGLAQERETGGRAGAAK